MRNKYTRVIFDQYYLQLIRNVGFKSVECIDELDYFSANVSKEACDVASFLGAHSMVLNAELLKSLYIRTLRWVIETTKSKDSIFMYR